MTARLTLPARLDLSVAGTLTKDLLAHQGNPCELDCSQVTLLGTPGLQVLLSAKMEWAEEGHALSLTAPSEKFLAQLERFGLTQADLESVPSDTSEEPDQ